LRKADSNITDETDLTTRLLNLVLPSISPSILLVIVFESLSINGFGNVAGQISDILRRSCWFIVGECGIYRRAIARCHCPSIYNLNVPYPLYYRTAFPTSIHRNPIECCSMDLFNQHPTMFTWEKYRFQSSP